MSHNERVETPVQSWQRQRWRGKAVRRGLAGAAETQLPQTALPEPPLGIAAVAPLCLQPKFCAGATLWIYSCRAHHFSCPACHFSGFLISTQKFRGGGMPDLPGGRQETSSTLHVPQAELTHHSSPNGVLSRCEKVMLCKCCFNIQGLQQETLQ